MYPVEGLCETQHGGRVGGARAVQWAGQEPGCQETPQLRCQHLVMDAGWERGSQEKSESTTLSIAGIVVHLYL